MKKLFLLLSLLFFLSGCDLSTVHLQSPVRFYYLAENYQEHMSSVIHYESREAAGHREDLSYLMALYLVGPTQQGLRAPMPKGTMLFSVEQEQDTIVLRLSDTEKTMTDVEYSLACACLSLTCFDLTDAQSVTVYSGSRDVTMTRDNLITQDSAIAATEEST